MFYLTSFSSGLDVHSNYPDVSSLVSVLGPYSFDEARQQFHQLWCELWDLDQSDLAESDSAFFRSSFFQRSDGRLGFDDLLLDRHGCPDHVHRGA